MSGPLDRFARPCELHLLSLSPLKPNFFRLSPFCNSEFCFRVLNLWSVELDSSSTIFNKSKSD